ncbi:MAG: hypothetical protein ABSA83_06580 [Verrucomicrobiota bacterium]|jgi:hypothetical protein
MRSRIFFGLIAGFWLVMNFLLWRSQSLAHNQIGSAIPVEIVWDKILTAPDNSSLEIYDHGKKAGFCQWLVTGGGAAQALNQSLSRDYAPDGLAPQPAGYGLSLEGNAMIFGTNRVRFEMQLRLSSNESWREFRLTAKAAPTSWDIRGSAVARKILVKVNDEGGSWQTTVDFSDFDHPETLLREFGGEDVAGLAAVLPLQKDAITKAAAGIRWTAHEDWMQLGHSKLRVYRLETEILGQRLSIFASRAGEVLRVDGPDELTLRNEAFSHL